MTAIKPTTRNLELGTENRGTQNLRHSVALAFNANSAVFPMPEPLPPLDFNGNGHVAVVHCHPLSPTPVPNPRRVYWFCKAAKWASGRSRQVGRKRHGQRQLLYVRIGLTGRPDTWPAVKSFWSGLVCGDRMQLANKCGSRRSISHGGTSTSARTWFVFVG